MMHQHPLDKITRHPRLFLGHINPRVYLRNVYRLRISARQTWDEFLYQGWEN